MASRTHRGPPRTYAESGVDLASRGTALAALLRRARYQAPPSHGRPVAAPGHFAGLIRIGRETIAVTTDTVGTKVLLARQLGRWEEVGEDLVAINVNDLAAVGARPAAVVDTILCDRAELPVFRALGRGIRRGLAEARCSLVGGETALVGELIHDVDLGATAIGFFPGRRRPILGGEIRPGDRILGLASTGVHANGFTLVRRLLGEARVRLDRPRPGGRGPVGRELLRASRTYTRAVDAIAGLPGVVGLAHLSGAGFRNLLRLNSAVRFDLTPGAPPPLFAWLQGLGEISDREMYQTFNMGIGFSVIVRPRAVREVVRALRRAGAADVREIGAVASGRGVALPELGLRYGRYT